MGAVNKVLVVGGGISGLAAAVAFRQQGIAVDLLEKNPDHSVYGVGIIQPNNTLRALDAIGLAEACVARGGPFSGWNLFDRDGNPIAETRNAGTAAPHLPPINGITRPILHEILVKAAQDAGANLRVGMSVARWADEGDHVFATLSDGSEASYDLIVGCDGLYSQIRGDLFPGTFTPTYTGQSVWRYNFPRPKEIGQGEIWYGTQTKVGITPIAPDLMYIFVVTHEPGNPRMERAGLAEKLRERLSEYGGRIATLREQVVDDEAVVYRPMEHMLVPAPWYKGRAVLIGDAAHATTPHLAQGAAMAIEDSVLLAELMARDAPLPDLLDEFMRRRFDRAKFVVETSSQLAEWELDGWRGIENPDANHGALMGQAELRLMEVY